MDCRTRSWSLAMMSRNTCIFYGVEESKDYSDIRFIQQETGNEHSRYTTYD